VGTLSAALSLAEKGFRVFPVVENGKVPAIDNWTFLASSDPDRVRSLWTSALEGYEENYNIGILTGHDGLIVLDVDVREGKHGLDSLAGLHITPTTLIAETPSGGFHYFFSGLPCANAVELLGSGSGIDIRSHNGYVVGAGSEIDGKRYSFVNDSEIEMVPDVLASLLKPPGTRTRGSTDEISDDSEAALAEATHYLKYNAPVAVKGQGGNSTAYRVAAKLTRDLGLSEDATTALMLEHWNDRCIPPAWTERKLGAIVDHANHYGKGEKGSAMADDLLGDLDLEALASVTEDAPEQAPAKAAKPLKAAFGNIIPDDELLARQWIYSPILMRREITQLTAAGAGGKGSLVLALAIHGALGLPFMGHKLPDGAFRSIIYDAEDDRHEQSRRFKAICRKYELDEHEAAKRVMLLGTEDIRLKLTTDEKGARNEKHIDEMVRLGKARDIGMIALGPLVKLHTVDEIDNDAMDRVMEILKEIAVRSDVGVLLSHHVSKPSNTRVAGDVNAGRGASSIATACRINVMLSGMSKEEQERYSVTDDDRPRLSRLDDSKGNYALRRGTPLWIKMHSFEVEGKGWLGDIKKDSVGVPMEYDIQESGYDAAVHLANIFAAEAIEDAKAFYEIKDAADKIKVVDHFTYGHLDARTVKLRIEALLRKGARTTDGNNHVVYDTQTRRVLIE